MTFMIRNSIKFEHVAAVMVSQADDSISAVAKDIFVWIVRPRRSVNYFNCAA